MCRAWSRRGRLRDIGARGWRRLPLLRRVRDHGDVSRGEGRLRETSDYPWSGEVRIEIDPEAPAAFDLKLRIPGWAKGATTAVNGEPIALTATNGYATIHRVWRKGDAVTLDLKMPAERLYAHLNVRMDVGRAALRRGPLIYCVEEADNPGGPVQNLRCRARRPSTRNGGRTCLAAP